MELAALEKKLQRLRDAFLCGAEGIQEYKREKERLTEQANHLRQELLSFSREVCAASEQHDEIQKIVTTLRTLPLARRRNTGLPTMYWNPVSGTRRRGWFGWSIVFGCNPEKSFLYAIVAYCTQVVLTGSWAPPCGISPSATPCPIRRFKAC